MITIEASDPVPYVASQPDPKTFVVEMRDVVAVGGPHQFKADPRIPIAARARRERARLRRRRRSRASASTLSQPMRPRVRSSRNVIYVEADRLDTDVPPRASVSGLGPSTAIRRSSVRRAGRHGGDAARHRPDWCRPTVRGVEGRPARLVMNLANVTSAVP